MAASVEVANVEIEGSPKKSKIEAWQERVQRTTGLGPEYTKSFSIVRYWEEEAKSPPIVVDLSETQTSQLVFPDFSQVARGLSRLFKRATAIF